jgi:hypothetical protein
VSEGYCVVLSAKVFPLELWHHEATPTSNRIKANLDFCRKSVRKEKVPNGGYWWYFERMKNGWVVSV